MSARPHTSAPPQPPNPLMAVLEAVWGPAYPLLLVLLGFPGLLALFVAAGSRDEVPLMAGFLMVLAGGAAAMALCGAAWAVQRLARVQRIWAARLAPRAAGQRVAQAVALGLGLTWFITTAPMVLLWATQSAGMKAMAAASLLAVLMLAVAAWACAWQGRIGWWGLAPTGVGVVGVVGLGALDVWVIWLQAGWPVHGLAGAVCAIALPRLLAAHGAGHGLVPALLWETLTQKVTRFWQRRYRRVREQGEQAPGWVGVFIGSFIGSGLKVARWDTPFTPWPQAASSVFFVIACLAVCYSSVYSADLHWRHWLAPGNQLRSTLGTRVLKHTLAAHGRVALALLTLALLMAAVWPWDSRVSAAMQVVEVAITLTLYWLLAIPLAVWLRGMETSSKRRCFIAIGVLIAWALIGALLVWAGLDTRGELLLALVPLSALVLVPALTKAWARRDLAAFRQQNKTTGELT